MKNFLLALVLGSLSMAAWSKTFTVNGEEARTVMEALSASGFQFENMDGEWSGKTITVKTQGVFCHYTAALVPDEWMTNVTCSKDVEDGDVLGNSLALSRAISKYALVDVGVGNRWLSVNSIDCALVYDEKNYSCKIDSDVE
jgi:hypothetical protein